ncbi:hypothetical protein V5O48_015999, partial [Marasmius crinis-equi]
SRESKHEVFFINPKPTSSGARQRQHHKPHEDLTTPDQVLAARPPSQSDKPAPRNSLPDKPSYLSAFSHPLSSAVSEAFNIRGCAPAPEDTSTSLSSRFRLGGDWKEVLYAPEARETHPGFITSELAVRMPTDELI